MAADDQELDKLYPGIEKQTRFALATTMTALAKESQAAAIDAIHDRFTVRGNWVEPSNRFGVRIKSATVKKLEASVGTDADWLVKHETGKDRTGGVAVPTSAIRPNITDKITKSKRPRNLKNAFKLTTSTGATSLFRKVRRALVPLYRLVRTARIEKQSTVIEPTIETFEQKLPRTFAQKLAAAFRSAK